MTQAPSSPDDFDAKTRQALIRQLTNLVNRRATDWKHHNDQFNKYGILLEGIYSHLEKIENKLLNISAQSDARGHRNDVGLAEVFERICLMEDSSRARHDQILKAVDASDVVVIPKTESNYTEDPDCYESEFTDSISELRE